MGGRGAGPRATPRHTPWAGPRDMATDKDTHQAAPRTRGGGSGAGSSPFAESRQDRMGAVCATQVEQFIALDHSPPT